jgi:hypothetical protein
MPTKKIWIYCTKCQRTSETDYEVATAYMSKTRWMCDCGEMYHISDYVNGPTYASHMSKEDDDKYTKYMEEHTRKESIMDKEQGREMYHAVDKWLNALSDKAISGIEQQRTFHHVIDRELYIETILEHCRTEDDLLERLYKESLGTIDFNADNNSPQCFTDKKDWYILHLIGGIEPELSRQYDTEQEVITVIEAIYETPDNSKDSYTYLSVTKGAVIDF